MLDVYAILAVCVGGVSWLLLLRRAERSVARQSRTSYGDWQLEQENPDVSVESELDKEADDVADHK